jgi:hypothetical protein
MTQDTGADRRMPAEVDGKQVVSAFRRMPMYGSLNYTYLVIVDEARRGFDDMNLYTVGIAFHAYGRDVWAFMDGSTRRDMPMATAMRKFAQMAYHSVITADPGTS